MRRATRRRGAMCSLCTRSFVIASCTQQLLNNRRGPARHISITAHCRPKEGLTVAIPSVLPVVARTFCVQLTNPHGAARSSAGTLSASDRPLSVRQSGATNDDPQPVHLQPRGRVPVLRRMVPPAKHAGRRARRGREANVSLRPGVVGEAISLSLASAPPPASPLAANAVPAAGTACCFR